jgi:hypothetical protein
MKKKGGGGVSVVSIDRPLLYISANFFLFLKDPGPLNNKKRFSGAKQLSMLPD